MKISKFSSLISKVSGCSGSSFSGSSSILAETAKSPAPWAFMTSTEVTNRVSASEAVTVSVFPSRLKRKLSRIGKEFLEAITLLIDCKRDNSAVLDTSNLIALIFYLVTKKASLRFIGEKPLIFFIIRYLII